jgi:hypothetical protein
MPWRWTHRPIWRLSECPASSRYWYRALHFFGVFWAWRLRDCSGAQVPRIGRVAGVESLTIVETRDAVLVSTGTDGEDLKTVVGELGRRGRPEHIVHPRQYRPWGYFALMRRGKVLQYGAAAL